MYKLHNWSDSWHLTHNETHYEFNEFVSEFSMTDEMIAEACKSLKTDASVIITKDGTLVLSKPFPMYDKHGVVYAHLDCSMRFVKEKTTPRTQIERLMVKIAKTKARSKCAILLLGDKQTLDVPMGHGLINIYNESVTSPARFPDIHKPWSLSMNPKMAPLSGLLKLDSGVGIVNTNSSVFTVNEDRVTLMCKGTYKLIVLGCCTMPTSEEPCIVIGSSSGSPNAHIETRTFTTTRRLDIIVPWCANRTRESVERTMITSTAVINMSIAFSIQKL